MKNEKQRGRRMKTRRVTAIILALVCLYLQVFAEEASEPLVSCGNRVFYTATDGEALLQSQRMAVGGTLSEEEMKQLEDAVLQTLADQAVLILKYEELGLNEKFSGAETIVAEKTREAYESIIAQTAAQMRKAYGGTEEKSLITARALLDQTGMTYEMVEKQIFAQWVTQCLGQAIAGDLEVTDEELDALYQEQFVEPARQKYQENPAAFEEKVLFGDELSSYIPAGFRLVRWIVIQPEKELSKELRTVTDATMDAYEKAVKAYEATFGTFENDEALQIARKNYEDALTEYGIAMEEAEKIKQKVLDATSDTVSEIRRAYGEGIAFDDLIRQYSADDTTLENPYPIHSESRVTDQDLKELALSINSVGEISEPKVFSDGVWLILYERDQPEGAAEITEETRAVMKDMLLSMKQTEKIEEMLPAWQQEYEISTWPERLMTQE